MVDIYRKKRRKLVANKGTGSYPKFFFISFALMGSILIWTVKSLDAHYLVTILIPVSLICIYCFVASKFSLFHIREDQIGDNAYYLGFLFTLSSLSFALWKFSAGHSDPKYIIGSFGVALWSTIFGIALRVFFSQMRQDPSDIEADARAKIAETASALTVELNQAALSFNTYRRNLSQSLEEAFEEVSKTISQNLTTGVDKFSASAQEMVAQIQNTFSEFSDNSKKLNDSSAKTVRALEKLNERIENMESPDNVINNKIHGIFAEIEETSKKLSNLSIKQTGSVEKLAQSSEILIQNIESLNSQVAVMKDQTATIASGSKHLDVLPEKIKILNTSLEQFSESLNTILTNQETVSKSIENHANELEKQLGRSRDYTEETHKSVVSMVRTLDSKLK